MDEDGQQFVALLTHIYALTTTPGECCVLSHIYFFLFIGYELDGFAPVVIEYSLPCANKNLRNTISYVAFNIHTITTH